MTLRRRWSRLETGHWVIEASPKTAALQHVAAEVRRFKAGEQWVIELDDVTQETAAVVVQGQLELEYRGERHRLMGRQDVFETVGPYVMYWPPGPAATLRALTEAEVCVARARRSQGTRGWRLITPDEVSVEVRGDGVTERTVRHLLEGADDADSLLLVEVVTPGGHWSSFPPHKHDTPSSSETWLEELYYFRVRPEDTWALQYVYRTQDDGEALAVYDGDLVMVPRGYHPVSAPPGTDVYYLNVMAGPERVWRFSVDPAFSHVPGFSPPPIRG